MKVLLVSEGPSELDGALQHLVTRLGMAEAEIDLDRVSQRNLHAHHGKGRGYFKRAVRWMHRAKELGYDALVLVIDQDGLPERTREINEAQQYNCALIRRALGVAIRSFDAWILADEKALTEVLGIDVQRQPAPESVRDPKGVCRELLEKSDRSMRPTEMYAAVAEIIDLHGLEKRSPNGFAPFAQRVRDLTAS